MKKLIQQLEDLKDGLKRARIYGRNYLVIEGPNEQPRFLVKKRPMFFKGGRNRQARNVLKLLWRDTYYHKGVRV